METADTALLSYGAQTLVEGTGQPLAPLWLIITPGGDPQRQRGSCSLVATAGTPTLARSPPRSAATPRIFEAAHVFEKRRLVVHHRLITGTAAVAAALIPAIGALGSPGRAWPTSTEVARRTQSQAFGQKLCHQRVYRYVLDPRLIAKLAKQARGDAQRDLAAGLIVIGDVVVDGNRHIATGIADGRHLRGDLVFELSDGFGARRTLGHTLGKLGRTRHEHLPSGVKHDRYAIVFCHGGTTIRAAHAAVKQQRP